MIYSCFCFPAVQLRVNRQSVEALDKKGFPIEDWNCFNREMTGKSVKCREFEAKWTFYWTNVQTKRRIQMRKSKMCATTIRTRQSTAITFCLDYSRTRESRRATMLTRSSLMIKFSSRRLRRLSLNRDWRKFTQFRRSKLVGSALWAKAKRQRASRAFQTTAQPQSTFITIQRSRFSGATLSFSSPWLLKWSHTVFSFPSAFSSLPRKSSSRTIN